MSKLAIYDFVTTFPKGLVKINGEYYEVDSYSMANGGGRRQAVLVPLIMPTKGVKDDVEL